MLANSIDKFGPNSAKLRRQLYKASHISASTDPGNIQTSQRSVWHLVNVNRMSNMMSQSLPPSLAFSSSPRQRSNTPWRRLDMSHHERLFTNDNAPSCPGEDYDRSKVDFSGRLPGWLWAVLTALLGIGGGKRKTRRIIATTFHMLTVFSALLFASCGIFYNVYDIKSEMTRTTVLCGICKTFLGAYWVGIGIYAHSLAARLFSNTRFVDCIRMHSKTIFKINTAVIIVILATAAVFSNIYWTRFLLEQFEGPVAPNTTGLKDGNCVTAGVNVALCEIYFVARVVYSSFNLLWNLLVATILLSVCRTHTICIRRFMKELLYDTKIFEEFMMMQALGSRVTLVEESLDLNKKPKKMTTIMESNIWDDDINVEDEDGSGSDAQPPDNAHILHSMRSIRQSTFDSGSTDISFGRSRMFSSSQQMEFSGQPMTPSSWSQHDHFPPELHQDQEDDELILSPSTFPASLPFHFESPTEPVDRGATTAIPIETARNVHINGNISGRHRIGSHVSAGDQNGPQGNDVTHSGHFSSALSADEAFYRKALEEGNPPILSNEDLYFTHFQLVRRLCSTSRLLQRWMLNLISFILMWCALLIIYWTNHEANWLGLFEFIIPLFILYLLSSAYAEVNFEGQRIIRCVLPTQERLSILYYMQAAPLELKVFSFSLSYNAIMTVVAGVAAVNTACCAVKLCFGNFLQAATKNAMMVEIPTALHSSRRPSVDVTGNVDAASTVR
ncbi:hypothetical protein RRG08_014851 [Elysia crispata]|uniref:Uncharacterized protein n=1 Tax=Elysia crispata TaxID=231223 RepID=A0AAE1DB78_9GAST|nr:hypothetical protein RRG08_014851 [Elysia crispata]